MPWQHFRCPNCGTVDLITYRAADVDDPAIWPPICGTPECFDWRMERAPQPGDFRIDVKTDGDGGRGAGTTKGFQKFTVYQTQPGPDGRPRQVPVTIDSLYKLRQVEKDSEQRYRDGEGEPLRFRAWGQDRQNMDVGSFGARGKIGTLEYDTGRALPRKPDKVEIRRHGSQRPEVRLAKGGGASPLRTKVG